MLFNEKLESNNVDKISKIRITIFNKINCLNHSYKAGIYFISIILSFSGISKILNPLPFMESVRIVTRLPENTIILLSAIFPMIEVLLGVLIVIKKKLELIIKGTLILFSSFFFFSIYGTVLGLKNDCGCFGNLIKSEFGPLMVLRNGLFLFVVILIYKRIKNVKKN